MGRSDTVTLIPLDRAARHLGIDLYHFNSIQGTYAPIHLACDDDWYQYDWQSAGKLSRNALAFALRQAEDMVMEHLRWPLVPRWFSEEKTLSQYYKAEVFSMRNSRFQPKSLATNWGMVIEPGIKATTLIDTPAILWVDKDGDTFKETARITFVTTVTEEQELHVYYPSKEGDDSWEIRPLTSIVIAVGVATIEFPRYLAPLEELIEKIPTDADPHLGIDGSDDTQFLVEVDVYRVYNDPSQQITFYYDPTLDCTTVPCNVATETGCMFVRDARRGILAYQRSDWNATTESFDAAVWQYGPPHKAMIYYKAGKQDIRQKYPDLQMDEALERMIVFYALSLLDTDLCGCDNTKKIWQWMTRDLALVNETRRYQILWGDLANPLGTSAIARDLWKHIQRLRLAPAPNPL